MHDEITPVVIFSKSFTRQHQDLLSVSMAKDQAPMTCQVLLVDAAVSSGLQPRHQVSQSMLLILINSGLECAFQDDIKDLFGI